MEKINTISTGCESITCSAHLFVLIAKLWALTEREYANME